MVELHYIKQGLYRDLYDQRLLLIARPLFDPTAAVCIKKAIRREECLRNSMRENPEYRPTADKPLRFFEEAKTHSCYGVYWHVHYPVKKDGKHIIVAKDVRKLRVDGIVSDPSIKERVDIDPSFRQDLEKILNQLKMEMTPEDYLRKYEVPFPYLMYRVVKRTPFICDALLKEPKVTIVSTTKMCGCANNHDAESMKDVCQQFEEKYADITRLQEQLAGIDVSTIPIRDIPVDSKPCLLLEATLELLDIRVEELSKESELFASYLERNRDQEPMRTKQRFLKLLQPRNTSD